MKRALLILGGLALALVALRLSPLGGFLSLDALREHREALLAFAAARPYLSAAGYMALYVAVVALSLPGAAIMTLAGGFLFGRLAGTALAALAATGGAALVFLLARRLLRDAKLGARAEAIAESLRQDGFLVLLSLRLVPLFPFVLVNLAPALVGMRLGPFVLATALGVVPGGFIYASAGAGLGAALEGGRVLTPGLVLALGALALVALLGIPLRRWLRRRGANSAG